MKINTLISSSNEFLDICHISRSLSENTISAYTQDLTEFENFCRNVGDEVVLDGALITSFVRHMKITRELNPATIKRRVACLKSFFRWAKEEQHISASPFESVSIVIRTSGRDYCRIRSIQLDLFHHSAFRFHGRSTHPTCS